MEAADIAAKKNPSPAYRAPAVEHLRADCPAIVASGLLMGLLGMVKTSGWVDPKQRFLTY